jgi:hypothetical protein
MRAFKARLESLDIDMRQPYFSSDFQHKLFLFAL